KIGGMSFGVEEFKCLAEGNISLAAEDASFIGPTPIGYFPRERDSPALEVIEDSLTGHSRRRGPVVGREGECQRAFLVLRTKEGLEAGDIVGREGWNLPQIYDAVHDYKPVARTFQDAVANLGACKREAELHAEQASAVWAVQVLDEVLIEQGDFPSLL